MGRYLVDNSYDKDRLVFGGFLWWFITNGYVLEPEFLRGVLFCRIWE